MVVVRNRLGWRSVWFELSEVECDLLDEFIRVCHPSDRRGVVLCRGGVVGNVVRDFLEDFVVPYLRNKSGGVKKGED